MKKQITIPVQKNLIRKLSDPFGKHDTTFAYVKLSDLPNNLPLDNNPRAQNVASRVARQITETLENEPEKFHYLNRGLTLTVPETKYDNQKQELVLLFPTERSGVLDGGHTYACALKLLAGMETREDAPEAYLRLEIMEGVRTLDMITDIARARNTSAQVKDESLANFQGRFDIIRDAVRGTVFEKLIAYRENEDSDEMPIGIREVVAFATMFHPAFNESENPPMITYSSKGKCMEHFLDESNEKGYVQVMSVLKDSLSLYDYVHQQMEAKYRSVGGFSGMDTADGGKKRDSVKLGKVREVEQRDDGYKLYYLDNTTKFKFPDGWLYPIVAAHRGLVSFGKNGTAKAFWKADPFKYFDQYGNALVKATLQTSREIGRNPNAVGKNKGHWTQLHDKVITQYLKLSGGKEDVQVEIGG